MVTRSHFCIVYFTVILKHTHHPNMEQHVYHFSDQLQGSTMDLFIFSCDVSGSSLYTIGHTFCHFPCLPLKSKDEITSKHRHSPMIFTSGTQLNSLNVDITTVLSVVFDSDFCSTHSCKHGAACPSVLQWFSEVNYALF